LKVEESKYKDHYQKKISLHYGNFYIFEKYVISEISEGVHFNWALAEEVIELVYEHFGSRDIKVAYISNRIYNYSVHAQDWLNFYKERHHLEAFAVVAYTKLGFMNVILEKVFSQIRLKKFSSLDDAVEWVLSLNPCDGYQDD
jgi:hypothetical protein